MFNGPVFNNETIQSNARAVNGGGISESLDEANALYSRLTGASFELVPSSYKGGTLYSGAPGANGDLSWTRGGDAFRTSASGVIQRMPWNLVRYSEDFTNAVWVSDGTATITSNATTAPDGNLTADRLQFSNSQRRYVYQTITPSQTTYTYSIYLRANSNQSVRIGIDQSCTFYRGALICNVTNEWQRFTLTVSNITAGTTLAISVDNITSNITQCTGTAANVDLFIWGAQLVEGTTAQTYLPTTDRLNFPRLDYTYGATPAMLLEPQRTNLATQSTVTSFGPSSTANSWVNGTAIPASINETIGVNGTLCATKYTKTAGNTTQDFLYKVSVPVTSGTVYTVSGYIKLGTASNAVIVINNTSSWNTVSGANFVCSTTNGFNTTEWKRFTITFTAPATSLINIHYGYHLETGVSAQSDGTFFFDGLQIEAGSYASTLISTTSTSVTRVADSFSRNNIYTNGLISASGGTWFVELRNNVAYTRDAFSQSLYVGDNATSIGSNGLLFRCGTGVSSLLITKVVGGAETTLGNLTAYTTPKVVLKWDGTNVVLFINGTKIVTSSFTSTNMNFLVGNGNDVPKFIQQMALFPSPLSDADCASLTADYTDGTSIVGNYERYVSQRSGAVENLSGVTNLIQNLK